MSFPNNRHGNTPPYLLSAYGIAVKHGYSGTEEEWLASLKGDQGEYPRMQFDSETGYLQIRYDDSGEWTDIASLAELMTESEEAVIASAKEYADTAEAYAKGTVDDEAVEEGDPGYEDNAKYYAGQASTYASAAGGFATGASNYAQAASGYATTASGHAGNAATSATAAAGSASDAAGSATSASNSAGSASTSASAAEAQATQAGTYAYNADQSAQQAASYAAAANTAYGAVVDVANGVDVKVEDIETQVSIAAGYATNAGTSATNAATSATAASGSATAAAGSATTASGYASAAAASAVTAGENAEAWAVGTRGGQPVPQTDDAYENNSKYYAEQAADVAESIPEDYSELSDDVADLKSAIYTPNTLTEWESGAYRSSDGTKYTNNAYIRSPNTYISFMEGTSGIVTSAGYQFMIWAWDNSDNYIGSYHANDVFEPTGSALLVDNFDCSKYPNYKFKVAVCRTTQSTSITPSEGVNLKCIRTTDLTLTLAGKAADAKRVGTSIRYAQLIHTTDGEKVSGYENGGWIADSPFDFPDRNDRIRPIGFLAVKSGDVLIIDNGTHYKCGYCSWIGTPINYIHSYHTANWITDTIKIISPFDGFFAVAFADITDDTMALNPAEFDGGIYIQRKVVSPQIEIYKNQYIRTNVNTNAVVNMTPVNYNNWITYVYNCLEGDKFTITGHGGNGGRLWAFITSGNRLISKSEADKSLSEDTVIAPANARKIIVNTTTTCDYNLSVYSSPVSNTLINRSKIYTPIITDPEDLFVKPAVAYINHNIQEDTATVCTKFGIFKNGDNFCVTYAENITHSNADAPDLSETGTMRYRYRYFKLINDTESDVVYGDVAKKGSEYLDIDDTVQTLVGGVSYGGSVNNKLFFASAYVNDEIPEASSSNNIDYMPCVCDVTLSNSGVTFGTIHELKLIANGVTGNFNAIRFGGWMKEYYTSCPPYYDNNGYKWLIPCDGGFAYLTSTDAITWTLVNTCKLSYQPYKEISCIAISNNRLLFSARLYDEDDTTIDGNYTVVGIYDIAANYTEIQYRITSEHAKTFLAKIGTTDIGVLYVTDAGMKHATCYMVHPVDFKRGMYFIKWFEVYADATFYSAILQDTLNSINFSEMYIVGGNGKITNHASGFLKLTFDTSKPKEIESVPFCVV